MKLKNDIRYYRKLMGLTIKELAPKIEMSPATLQRLEQEETDVKLTTAIIISRFFQVPIEILFYEKGNAPDRILPDHILKRVSELAAV